MSITLALDWILVTGAFQQTVGEIDEMIQIEFNLYYNMNLKVNKMYKYEMAMALFTYSSLMPVNDR